MMMDLRERWQKDPRFALFNKLPPNTLTEGVFERDSHSPEDFYFHIFKDLGKLKIVLIVFTHANLMFFYFSFIK